MFIALNVKLFSNQLANVGLVFNLFYTVSFSFLTQNIQSFSKLPESKDLSNINVNQCLSFEAVMKSYSILREQLEKVSRQIPEAGWLYF